MSNAYRSVWAALRFAVGAVLMGVVALGCGQPKITLEEPTSYPEQAQAFVPATYTLGYGDVLEIIYHSDPDRSVAQYVIGYEDKLRIDFFNHPDLDREITVRPDGRITLPLIGDIMAVDKTPMELGKELQDEYQKYLRHASVTVTVVEFNAKLNELKEAITSWDRGQAREVVVQPDGNISLPYIETVQVAGLTLRQVEDVLEDRYEGVLTGMALTVDIQSAKSNMVYVMGQVTRPNYIQLIGPTTVTQAIAMAGGFTNDANTQQVVLVSRGPDKAPVGQLLNMDEIIGKGNIGNDVMLKQYDVVFVPSTKMSQAGLVGQQLWNIIPVRFSGTLGYQWSNVIGNAF